MDEVSTVILTKRAFSLMAQFGNASPEAKEYTNLVKDLSGLRLFTTENVAIAKEMKAVVDTYLKSSKLSELMRIKDKGVTVNFYIREGKDEDHVKELLMFVYGIGKYTKGENLPIKSESVILSLTGDINLNEISKLMEKMDISEGKHLKKLNKQ